MDNDEKLKIEERIVDMLKTVYDPEIPVNVYDLGLIYKIDLQENGDVSIDYCGISGTHTARTSCRRTRWATC